MIHPLSRPVLAFLAVMLLLAAAGSVHQRTRIERAELLATKNALVAEMGDLRTAANRVRGPRAVRAWALERGMIPAPENVDTLAVAPLAPPLPTPPSTGLEVTTVWR